VVTTQVHQVKQWQGPLPSPDDLARFNEIIPDGAQRIVAMAENEQKHRLAHEAAVLDANRREARRGQYFGTGLSAFAIAGAVYVAIIGGSPWVSASLVGVPFAGVIVSLINSRSGTKKP